MLDPQGRKEVLSIIHRLHQNLGKTVILITHFVEEAIEADRVCLMEKGRILAVGTPSKILAGQTLCDAGLLHPLLSGSGRSCFLLCLKAVKKRFLSQRKNLWKQS